MKRHELKCWPFSFQAIIACTKRFELRRDDRGYEVGDELWLREWEPERGYTGHQVQVRITWILRDAEQFGLVPGFVAMSIVAAEAP